MGRRLASQWFCLSARDHPPGEVAARGLAHRIIPACKGASLDGRLRAEPGHSLLRAVPDSAREIILASMEAPMADRPRVTPQAAGPIVADQVRISAAKKWRWTPPRTTEKAKVEAKKNAERRGGMRVLTRISSETGV